MGSPEGCEDLSPPDATPHPLDLPRTDKVRGVDASSLAPWKMIREAGFAFAFAGATHGLTRNASFARNWEMMKRCRLPRGAYHFLTDKSDGAAQARLFADQIGADQGELPPILDVEKPTDCRGDCCELGCNDWKVIVNGFVDELERRSTRAPMIYTVEPFWNQCLCGTTKLGAGHPLWLAGWPKFNFPEKVAFGGWKRWAFYQHAGNVRLGGGAIDLDLFQGTAADLGRFIETGKLPDGG